MTFRTPLWTQGAPHDAEVLRQLTGVLLSDGIGAGADMAVTQRGAGANMSVDVAAGRVVVDDYVCWSDAVVNLAIGAPPAPGQSRIDSVQAIVTDDNSGSGAWAVTVVAGTSSASPSAPAVPSNGVELARVTSTSATTSITNSNITDRRPSAVRGPYRTALPATGVDGQVVTLPGGSIAVRSSGAWIVHEPQTMWPVVEYRNIAGPLVKTPGSGSLGIGVNLPVDRPLKVVATVNGAVTAPNPGTATLIDTWLRITGTGFTTVNSEAPRIRAPYGSGEAEAFAVTFATEIPASPNPTLSVQYTATFASAAYSGVNMSVMVFPG